MAVLFQTCSSSRRWSAATAGILAALCLVICNTYAQAGRAHETNWTAAALRKHKPGPDNIHNLLQQVAEKQFQPWSTNVAEPFTTTQVDKLHKKVGIASARFLIRNRTIHAIVQEGLKEDFKGHVGLAKRMLEVAHATKPLPDGLDFVWNLDDRPMIQRPYQNFSEPPLFALCTSSSHADVPLPALEFLKYPSGFGDVGFSDAVPWADRQDVAFWRGSPTGGQYDKETWRTFARPRLVNLSVQHPDLIDAKFFACYQCGPGVWEEMLEQLGEPDATGTPPIDRLLKYKYIVDLDGNGWSSRFLGQLPLGAVILKVQPHFVDFFWELLQPYEHYLPVQADLSNLVHQLKFARAHEQEMKRITRASGQFFVLLFAKGGWKVYLHHLLSLYHARFGKKSPNKTQSGVLTNRF